MEYKQFNSEKQTQKQVNANMVAPDYNLSTVEGEVGRPMDFMASQFRLFGNF